MKPVPLQQQMAPLPALRTDDVGAFRHCSTDLFGPMLAKHSCEHAECPHPKNSKVYGVLFTCLNTVVRSITLTLDGLESQFLRYLFGFLVMLPLLIQEGWRTYIPVDMKGQFWRGGVHSIGLWFWFAALPKISLADMTAIGFSGPIFIMIGASLFLGEPMRRDRWIAALIGLLGVAVVVAPKLSGDGGWYLSLIHI